VGNPDRIRTNARELVGLAPEVILATSGTSLPALLDATRTVPIVFVRVADPVGAGFVSSLAHPGGNVTGFIVFEYGIANKWLELLKQIVPSVTRAAVLRDPRAPAGIGQFGALQSAASTFGVELTPVDVRDVSEIERGIAVFANSASAGLIVTGSELAAVHRDLIVNSAARYKLPAVYSDSYFVEGGGLISYGPNRINEYRRAAGYVDRILRGEKPANLPVQAPTKFELVINLKTTKTLGLTIPQSLLATADEVIE
jgi:putative tryptophan/tyrosine transport system substrate-binding protein